MVDGALLIVVGAVLVACVEHSEKLTSRVKRLSAKK